MSDFKNKQVPLPKKEEGVHKDIEAKIKVDSNEDAKQLFEVVKSRLLDINNWDKICGASSAEFTITDVKGQKVKGSPQVGFCIRIDVPGPGPKTGDGFDWVQIEAIEENNNVNEDSEFILIRVRPSSNPTTSDNAISHFFSEKATSNFLVIRENNTITAAVLGRNEVANTTQSESLIDTLRNAVVGISAAIGLANPQWKSLVNGLLGKT